MAKDPAFLFYPDDFIIGTQFFTDAQVGKYIRLLCAQFQHGHLTEQQILYICTTNDTVIMSKFIKDERGLYYNERLDYEKNKRKLFCISRRENVSKGYIRKTSELHKGNGNVNGNKEEKGGAGENKTDLIFDFENLKREFLNSESWQEQILMSSYAKGVTKQQLKVFMISFCEILRDKGEIQEKLFSEHKRHFISWLRVEIKKQKDEHRSGDKGTSIREPGEKSYPYSRK